MDSIVKFFEEKLAPVASKVSTQRHLMAIRDGLVLTMPLMIVGSVIIIFSTDFPIPGWADFITGIFPTWDDFISSEGEEVLFDEKLHYISFFACERKVFNSLLTVYLSANRFTDCKLADFNAFKIGFKEDVFKHINNMKEMIVFRKRN